MGIIPRPLPNVCPPLAIGVGDVRVNDPSAEPLQEWIDRLRAGDPAARDELLRRSGERLRKLARKMLRQDFRRLSRWEDTNDVLQNALLRLLRALETVPPDSPADFFRLAARQIRRELFDLARRHYGPEGVGANHATNAGQEGPDRTPSASRDPGTETYAPDHLEAWGDFHRLVEELPAEERDVFDLLWYQGQTQAEAARVLGVSVPTVKRRWLAARLSLQERLKNWPVEW